MWGCRGWDSGLSPAPTPPTVPPGTVGEYGPSPSHGDSAEHSHVPGTVPRAQLSTLTPGPRHPPQQTLPAPRCAGGDRSSALARAQGHIASSRPWWVQHEAHSTGSWEPGEACGQRLEQREGPGPPDTPGTATTRPSGGPPRPACLRSDSSPLGPGPGLRLQVLSGLLLGPGERASEQMAEQVSHGERRHHQDRGPEPQCQNG